MRDGYCLSQKPSEVSSLYRWEQRLETTCRNRHDYFYSGTLQRAQGVGSLTDTRISEEVLDPYDP